MAKHIETKRSLGGVAIALALAVTLPACGSSRAASVAIDLSTQTLPSISNGTAGTPTPADKSYCSADGTICIDPGIGNGTAATTPPADKAYCCASGTICIEP